MKRVAWLLALYPLLACGGLGLVKLGRALSPVQRETGRAVAAALGHLLHVEARQFGAKLGVLQSVEGRLNLHEALGVALGIELLHQRDEGLFDLIRARAFM